MTLRKTQILAITSVTGISTVGIFTAGITTCTITPNALAGNKLTNQNHFKRILKTPEIRESENKLIGNFLSTFVKSSKKFCINFSHLSFSLEVAVISFNEVVAPIR